MSTQPAAQRILKHEAELLRSFADAYRSKFEHVIDRLNQSAPPPADDPAAGNAACIRLCVETLGMLLSTQTRLADALLAGLIGSAREPAE